METEPAESLASVVNTTQSCCSNVSCCCSKLPVWLRIILGFFLILLIFSVGLFAGKLLLCSPCPISMCGQNLPSSQIITPTPSPTEASAKAGDSTAGWKMYSEANLYSFRYPTSVNIENLQETIQVKIPASIMKASGLELREGIFMQFKIIKIPSTNLTSYVNSEIAKSEGITYKNANAFKINTYNAYSYTAEAFATSRTFYIQHPINQNTVVEIFDTSPDSTNPGYKKIVDQILSTFRFLE